MVAKVVNTQQINSQFYDKYMIIYVVQMYALVKEDQD